MDINRCQVLLAVLETGSLSSAANLLDYTPSGVSRMMKSLEDEIGFTLLIREHSGIQPTSDCLRLLPAVRELVYAAENCRQLAAQIRGIDVGTVIIGTAYSAYYVRLARVVSRFRETYPGIGVEVRHGYSSELAQAMHRHELDLCLISAREGDHHWLPLREDEMVAWLPATHELAQRDAVPLSAFADTPYIETYPGVDIDNARVFSAAGIEPNIQFSTTDSYATYSMVEAGLGIAMNNAINAPVWTGDVVIRPINPPQLVELGIASPRDMTPAAKTFLSFIDDHRSQLNE